MKANSPTSRLPGRSQHTPIPARQPTRHIIRAQRVVEGQQPLAALYACTLTQAISIYPSSMPARAARQSAGPGNRAAGKADGRYPLYQAMTAGPARGGLVDWRTAAGRGV